MRHLLEQPDPQILRAVDNLVVGGKPPIGQSASKPRHPGITGSPLKWHPKNQRSEFTSSSARITPLPYSPPVSEIWLMRSNISIGGSGNCALPGPNISPRPHASRSSYS